MLLGKAGAQGAMATRTRRNVATLTDASPDIVAYKKAVKAMKELSQADTNNPLGWTMQARIHGTAGAFNKCKHNTWNFAPWHRAYLYYFEEIVRKLSGYEEFALPFWDWTTQPQVPPLFYGQDNPLAHPRNPGNGTVIPPASVAEFVAKEVIDRILGSNNFGSFGGASFGSGELEVTPHNFIHRWVGRTMASGESPLDPVFWLHHANVDRLYSRWIIMHGKGSLPADNSWQNAAFADFFDRSGNVAGGNLKNSGTVDSTALGYVYEDLGSIEDFEEPEASRLGVSRAFESKEVTTAGGAALYKATSKVGPDGAKVLNSVAKRVNNNQGIRLRVRGVKTPDDQDTLVRVFINCKDPGRGTPITDPSYAGSFTFFGNHGGHGGENHGNGHAGGNEIYLDITKVFRNLYGDIEIKDDEPLNVALVSNPLFKEGEVQTVTPEKVLVELLSQKPDA